MNEADTKHHPKKGNKTTVGTTTGGGSRRWKHANKSSGSNTIETEDTASSKYEIEVVGINNIDIMKEIISYRKRKGVCPSKSADDFQRFCWHYIHFGVGNAEGWVKKMNEMKKKFNKDSAPMSPVDKEEFKLWKKIWGE